VLATGDAASPGFRRWHAAARRCKRGARRRWQLDGARNTARLARLDVFGSARGSAHRGPLTATRHSDA
jgi:hypothetical protein